VGGTSVESAVSDGVLTLTLVSQDGMNVLGVETRKQIKRSLKKYESDEDVRCVVIRSRGKAFSAGADINHLLTLDKKGAGAYAKFVRTLLGYIEDYPKPTIGVVEGVAVGGGLELLMALDIVLASPSARFGQTELNVGLIPGGGGTQRLPRIVGPRKAKEMIFTGDLISAQDALDLGLVNRVAEGRALEDELDRIVSRIKSKGPKNLRLAKRAMHEGMKAGPTSGFSIESGFYAEILSSPEAKARMKQFLERRD
jgi:enoyl-CoA hydratase/carnithine racemase